MRIAKLMSFGKAAIMLFVTVVTMPGAGYSTEREAHSQDSAAEADARVSSSAVAGLVRVEAKYVCMPNNKRFEKEQIPVEIDNKMYYGCCKMCVGMLKMDPKVRVAVDPVSGRQVDKAVAVIGATPDNKVYYFGNEQILKRFTPRSDTGK